MFQVLKFLFVILICCYFCQPWHGQNSTMVKCPLWHIPDENGLCVCSNYLNKVIICDRSMLFVRVGNCMTWNDETDDAQIQGCLFTPRTFKDVCLPISPTLNNMALNVYPIPINTSGDELDSITCGPFNRKGTQCKQCRDGYGPALFVNGNSCYDCSEHQYLWILNIFIQIAMCTLMYILFIPLQICVTCSPFNFIFTYSQLIVNGVKMEGRLASFMSCNLGIKFTDFLLTVLGFFNLDFFHATLPSSCLSTSLNVIDILLFDFIIAVYPIILTVIIFLCINLYDRKNMLIVFLSVPFTRFLEHFNIHWDPKETILKTFTTFFLLSFSKMFFTSIKLTLSVQAYNSKGDVISNSTVLLYDPKIKLFHSKHIPYAILAFSIVIVFNLLPTLLLLLYPTKCFRKSIKLCKFRRWDILHHIMDIFQGSFKDGTQGTRDYRCVSALYLLLRVGLGFDYSISFLTEYKNEADLWKWLSCGMFHLFLGMFFLSLKPYKKTWMNRVDGVVLLFIGVSLIMLPSPTNKLYLMVGAGLIVFVLVATVVYVLYTCIRKYKNTNENNFMS